MYRSSIMLFFLLALASGKNAFSQYTAYFEIKNEQRTGTTFEFDIFMQASPDSSYLSRGLMYVFYGLAAFGPGQPSTFVTPIHEDLINDSTFGSPQYSTNLPNPNGNRFAITLSSNFSFFLPPSSLFHAMVPDTPIALYHISMIMADTTKCPCVALDGVLMDGEQFFFNEDFNPPIDEVEEIPYGVGILPAEIGDFTAQLQGSQEVLLSWKTALEFQSDYFVVEKGKDTGDFHPLATVGAKGITESITDYSYIDTSPLEALSYYRIKQVNADGAIKYSHVEEFSLSLDDRIQVYPNPVEKEVFVKGYFNEEQTLSYSILEVDGKLIRQGTEKVKNGSHSFAVNLENLPAGTYLLRITDAQGESFVQKVSKRK